MSKYYFMVRYIGESKCSSCYPRRKCSVGSTDSLFSLGYLFSTLKFTLSFCSRLPVVNVFFLFSLVIIWLFQIV